MDRDRAEAAGTHMHSITGTITGLIDYGILAGDETIIEGARRAYDVGMRPFRSSYGWVKEFRWAPWLAEPLQAAGYAGFDINRGEANNTGDLIEAALLLGKAGLPGLLRRCRSHAAQSSVGIASRGHIWVREASGHEDDDEALWQRGAAARGGFCFGGINDLISYRGRSLPGQCGPGGRRTAIHLRSLGGDRRVDAIIPSPAFICSIPKKIQRTLH